MEQISTSTISVLSGLLLGLILATACWKDFCSRRIPNKLLITGALVGISLQIFLPNGSGLFSSAAGSLGGVSALYGCAAGLFLLMPLYVIRAMGAGDVKLMAMIGIFLGPASVLGAVLMTFLAGGVLAVVVALWRGVLRNTLVNVHSIMSHTMLNPMFLHKGLSKDVTHPLTKLPYALAITAGTIMQILLLRTGYAIFS